MAMVERLTIIRGVEKFELQTKTARWVLAKEEGYSPVKMLVSAIGACGGYVYQSVLENSHIPFEFEKIEVTYSREVERRAQPLKQVTIIFYVSVPEAFQARATRCLKLVSPNCPVIQSLAERITVEETVVFKK